VVLREAFQQASGSGRFVREFCQNRIDHVHSTPPRLVGRFIRRARAPSRSAVVPPGDSRSAIKKRMESPALAGYTVACESTACKVCGDNPPRPDVRCRSHFRCVLRRQL
jgi:hypothetical protein